MNDENYRAKIDKAIRDMTGEAILNGSHGHATIILERMFAHAKDCVEIVSRRFDPRIYGTVETVEQAKLFLGDPARRCDIIVEEADNLSDNHPFVRELAPFIERGNLRFKLMSPKMAGVVNVNYAVMDDRGFRYEQDKNDAVAVAAFGEGTKDFVGQMKMLFSTIWATADDIDIKKTAALA